MEQKPRPRKRKIRTTRLPAGWPASFVRQPTESAPPPAPPDERMRELGDQLTALLADAARYIAGTPEELLLAAAAYSLHNRRPPKIGAVMRRNMIGAWTLYLQTQDLHDIPPPRRLGHTCISATVYYLDLDASGSRHRGPIANIRHRIQMARDLMALLDHAGVETRSAAYHDPDETPEEYEAAVQIRCTNALRMDRLIVADRLQNGVVQDLHAARLQAEMADHVLGESAPDATPLHEHLATIVQILRDGSGRMAQLEAELRNPAVPALQTWRELAGYPREPRR